MIASSDLSSLERCLGVKFKDKTILETALTHRSYLNENPGRGLEHNERLEFLGDAVLELAVTEYLYKNYDLPEGDLTNLRAAIVRGEMLSKVAHIWNLNDYLRLSKGERRDTGKARQYILANAVEATIGAIYIDRGYEAAKKVISRDLISRLPEVMKQGLYIDAKSHFQELAQEYFRKTPIYRILSESGPDHSKRFKMGAFIESEEWGEGIGTSKREAEQAAAREALRRLASKIKGKREIHRRKHRLRRLNQ